MDFHFIVQDIAGFVAVKFLEGHGIEEMIVGVEGEQFTDTAQAQFIFFATRKHITVRLRKGFDFREVVVSSWDLIVILTNLSRA